MIDSLLILLTLSSASSDPVTDRWVRLSSDNTGTVLLDRLSIRDTRRQRLWVRVKWSNTKNGVVYSDWLENFDCRTSSSFPSRIIDYAADGTTVGEIRNDDGDFMSIINDESSPIVRDMACGAHRLGTAQDDR